MKQQKELHLQERLQMIMESVDDKMKTPGASERKRIRCMDDNASSQVFGLYPEQTGIQGQYMPEIWLEDLEHSKLLWMW